jgi:hypothetical protein
MSREWPMWNGRILSLMQWKAIGKCNIYPRYKGISQWCCSLHSVIVDLKSCCCANCIYKLRCLSFEVDRLCGLVVRVPGYTTEMYCASCEVRTEFIYVMEKIVDRLCV